MSDTMKHAPAHAGRKSKDHDPFFTRQIGDAIRARRIKLGLSTRQLAARTGGMLSSQAIGKYEKGTEPGIQKYLILCYALEVPLNALIPPVLSEAIKVRTRATLPEFAAALKGGGL